MAGLSLDVDHGDCQYSSGDSYSLYPVLVVIAQFEMITFIHDIQLPPS